MAIYRRFRKCQQLDRKLKVFYFPLNIVTHHDSVRIEIKESRLRSKSTFYSYCSLFV